MFPAKDLPAIVDDNNTIPTKTEDVKGKKTNGKRVYAITISNHQYGTIFCVVLILFIIAVAIFIGLLSIFIPKPNDDNPVIPTAVIITSIIVLSITPNTSNVLSLNNSSLIVDNYLNNAQRNILKACLQSRLNSENRTKFMIVISIDSARAQYSGNNITQATQGQRRKRSRIRRQTLSQADQVEIILSIQCSPLILMKDCRQIIESVLENGDPLTCTLNDEIITTLCSSPSSKTTIKTNTIAQTDNWRQVGQIFLAFGLTSLVGLERQLRGKNAGLRTHSIVGTTAALILQVSKYGFSDVIYEGIVVLDPSRIAAQIISGISFLGAGLIITRQKAIRGLTTAASVWSAAAIGMAAGSGLWVLSLAVTGLHFVILLGFLPLEKRLPVFDKNSPFHWEVDEDGDNDNDNDNQSL